MPLRLPPLCWLPRTYRPWFSFGYYLHHHHPMLPAPPMLPACLTSRIQMQATTASGLDIRPRLKGPGRKEYWSWKMRRKMGMPACACACTGRSKVRGQGSFFAPRRTSNRNFSSEHTPHSPQTRSSPCPITLSGSVCTWNYALVPTATPHLVTPHPPLHPPFTTPTPAPHRS